MTSIPDVSLFIGYVETTVNTLRLVHAARQGVSIKFESLKSMISKRLSKPALFTLIHSNASASHSDHPPTRDPIYRTHQSLPGPTSDMAGTDRSKPLPPPSPADTTGESRTHTVLQGTTSALKLIQQIVGLAPWHVKYKRCINPKNNYATEDALVELAQKAGSFMVSLVEQGLASTFSDPDSMNSVIEGLTKEMNRVLGVVNRISSQKLPTCPLLSASDKATVDKCNRLVLACGIFGIRISFIAQKAITRIEAMLNQALEILQELNQQTTTAQLARASTCRCTGSGLVMRASQEHTSDTAPLYSTVHSMRAHSNTIRTLQKYLSTLAFIEHLHKPGLSIRTNLKAWEEHERSSTKNMSRNA